MTKSLTLVVAISMWLCLAAYACAGPACLPIGTCWAPDQAQCPVPKAPKKITVSKTFTKKVTSETVLCRGGTRGIQVPCGPCAGPIKWSCNWKTAVLGPEVEAVYVATKKAKLVRVKTCADSGEAPASPK